MGDGLDAPGTFVRNHALNILELFSIMLYILVLLWLPRVHQILPKDKAMKDNEEHKRSALVEIFGAEYQIASEADHIDIQQVAAYVDQKMREVASHSGSGKKTGLAVLAAMEITAELLRLRQENEQLLQKAYESIERLNQLIDQRSTLLSITSDWMGKRVGKQHF